MASSRHPDDAQPGWEWLSMLKGVFNSLPIPIGRVSWNTTAPDKNEIAKGSRAAVHDDKQSSGPLEKIRTDAILDRLREADHRRSLSFKRRAIRTDRQNVSNSREVSATEGAFDGSAYKPVHSECGQDTRISCRVGGQHKKPNRSVPCNAPVSRTCRASTAEKYTFRPPPSLFDCLLSNGSNEEVGGLGRKRMDNAILASIASMPKKKSRLGVGTFIDSSPPGEAGPEAIRYIIREEMDRFQSKLKEDFDDRDRWTCVSCFSLVDPSIRTCPVCKSVRNAVRDLTKHSIQPVTTMSTHQPAIPVVSLSSQTTSADLHDKVPLFLKRPASDMDEAASKKPAPHAAIIPTTTASASVPSALPSSKGVVETSVPLFNFKPQTSTPQQTPITSKTNEEPVMFPLKFSFSKADSPPMTSSLPVSLSSSIATPIMSTCLPAPQLLTLPKPSEPAALTSIESTTPKPFTFGTSLFSTSKQPQTSSEPKTSIPSQNSSFVFSAPKPAVGGAGLTSTDTTGASKSVEMLETSPPATSSILSFSFQKLATSAPSISQFANQPPLSTNAVVPIASPITFTFGKSPSDNLFSLFGKSTKSTESSVQPTSEETSSIPAKPIFSFGNSTPSVEKPKLPAIPKIFQFGQSSQNPKAITESSVSQSTSNPFVFGSPANPQFVSSLTSSTAATKSDETQPIFGAAIDTVPKAPNASGSLLFGMPSSSVSRTASLFGLSRSVNSNEGCVNGVSAAPVAFGQSANPFQTVASDVVFGGVVPPSDPAAPEELNNPFSVQASEIAGRKTKHPRKQLQARK